MQKLAKIEMEDYINKNASKTTKALIKQMFPCLLLKSLNPMFPCPRYEFH